MNKDALLVKGNELIDMINSAMRAIEISDNAKSKVINPEATICLSIPIEGVDDFTDQLPLAEVLSEKSIDKIKAAILCELDVMQDSACHTLAGMGLRSPAVVNPEFEAEVKKMEEQASEPKKKNVPPLNNLPEEKVQKIAEMTAAGASVKEIAEELKVSPPTVRKYRGSAST